jgi:beta-lactamase regulating signal transducer with metallopeptidase domain
MDSLLTTLEPVVRWTAARLVEGSLPGAVLIVVVWVVCRVISIPPRTRAMLWWVASAKLVVSFLALPGVPLRVLPAADVVSPRIAMDRPSSVSGSLPGRPVTRADGAVSVAAPLAAEASTGLPARRIRMVDLLIGCWFAIVGGYVAALAVSRRRVGRLVAGALPLSRREASEVATLAARLDLRRAPAVLTSEAVVSPQAVGVWRPSILLPAGFASRVTANEWRMAVCHELMHVRRRDLIWGWIPALAERLFFFHPLAHVASDEYRIAREAACDAAVVRAMDVDAHDYGRMLLRLGVSRVAPGFAASGSSPRASVLRKRLEMLQQMTSRETRRPHGFVVAAVIALVPFQLAAQSPRLRDRQNPIATSAVPDRPALRPLSASEEPRAADADARKLPSGRDAIDKLRDGARDPQAPLPASQSLLVDRATGPLEQGVAPTDDRLTQQSVADAPQGFPTPSALDDMLFQLSLQQNRLSQSSGVLDSEDRAIVRARLERIRSELFEIQRASRQSGDADASKTLTQDLDSLRPQFESVGDTLRLWQSGVTPLRTLDDQLKAFAAQLQTVADAVPPANTQYYVNLLNGLVRDSTLRIQQLTADLQKAEERPQRPPSDTSRLAEQISTEKQRLAIFLEARSKAQALSRAADASLASQRADVQRERLRLAEAERRLKEAEDTLRQAEERLNQPK